MSGWKIKYRQVNGRKRKVKVRTLGDGREQIRLPRRRNYTNKGAARLGIKHKKGYYHATENANRPSGRL